MDLNRRFLISTVIIHWPLQLDRMSSRLSSGGIRVATLAVVSLGVTETVRSSPPQSHQHHCRSVIGPDVTCDSVEGVAGTVIVRGTVTGDIATAAGTVHVTETGEVGGNIEAAAGTVRIDGTVGGDVSVAGGTVEIGETAQIDGNLDVGASYLALRGTVDGTVQAGAEEFVLSRRRRSAAVSLRRRDVHRPPTPRSWKCGPGREHRRQRRSGVR